MNNNDNWSQVKVTADIGLLDTVTAIMSMLDAGLMIEDYSDIETGLNTVYGELIDEKILGADKTHASVSLFVPHEKPLGDYLAFLRERFAAAEIDAKFEVLGLSEEDWAQSWKQYYKPIKVGERLVVSPPWENYLPVKDEILVEMDPGMAFGTGTHETTRLVMRLLEQYVHGGERMLDIGCGSGILSISAAKLGCAACAAYDIDPVAVRVAKENIAANGLANITCAVSDLLADVDLSHGIFDIVTANIVADIVIRMAPDLGGYMSEDGLLFVSGIVDTRQIETIVALGLAGFDVENELHENGWCAMVLAKQHQI